MIKYHTDIVQGSEEWHAIRCGLLTASEMKYIITPKTLQYASNDKERAHLYELAAQRVTGYVEPHYVSDDMLRGTGDELDAKIIYNEKYAPLQDVGFITNNTFGFMLGFSPDALVGDDGLVECKSRRQRFQFQTIAENAMPDDFKIQVQTGLLVSGREWCDFISYCGGMLMMTLRIYRDSIVQQAIVEAATAFHEKLETLLGKYAGMITDPAARLIPTERKIEQEITL